MIKMQKIAPQKSLMENPPLISMPNEIKTEVIGDIISAYFIGFL